MSLTRMKIVTKGPTVMWPKFKLIQALMYVLVTCRNEEDQIKNERARVVTKFSPIISLLEFFQTLKTAYSAGLGRIWPNFVLVRDFIVILVICKNEEDPIKMKALEWSQHFPHYNLWEIHVAMETRVLIRSCPKPNAAFPPSQ